jgi:hypothetical protein
MVACTAPRSLWSGRIPPLLFLVKGGMSEGAKLESVYFPAVDSPFRHFDHRNICPFHHSL